MKSVDKLSADTKILLDSTKDVLCQNVMTAAKTKLIDLNEEQVSKLINLISVSINEGYQRALPSFQKKIKTYLVEE